VSDWQKYDGRYVGCNPVEVGRAAEERIAELEAEVKRLRAMYIDLETD